MVVVAAEFPLAFVVVTLAFPGEPVELIALVVVEPLKVLRTVEELALLVVEPATVEALLGLVVAELPAAAFELPELDLVVVGLPLETVVGDAELLALVDEPV
jgi:hypothetical protein